MAHRSVEQSHADPRIRFAPRGGWRAAGVAFLAGAMAMVLVAWPTLGWLGERVAIALAFGVCLATMLTVYWRLRVDLAPGARGTARQLAAAWVALCVLFGAGRLLLFG